MSTRSVPIPLNMLEGVLFSMRKGIIVAGLILVVCSILLSGCTTSPEEDDDYSGKKNYDHYTRFVIELKTTTTGVFFYLPVPVVDGMPNEASDELVKNPNVSYVDTIHGQALNVTTNNMIELRLDGQIRGNMTLRTTSEDVTGLEEGDPAWVYVYGLGKNKTAVLSYRYLWGYSLLNEGYADGECDEYSIYAEVSDGWNVVGMLFGNYSIG